MPCLNSNGTLTEGAITMMTVIADHHSLEEVASVTEIPLYLVRATARDLIDALLVNERDGLYYLSDLGTEKLKLTAGSTED
jgi:hypothetical protein